MLRPSDLFKRERVGFSWKTNLQTERADPFLWHARVLRALRKGHRTLVFGTSSWYLRFLSLGSWAQSFPSLLPLPPPATSQWTRGADFHSGSPFCLPESANGCERLSPHYAILPPADADTVTTLLRACRRCREFALTPKTPLRKASTAPHTRRLTSPKLPGSRLASLLPRNAALPGLRRPPEHSSLPPSCSASLLPRGPLSAALSLSPLRSRSEFTAPELAGLTHRDTTAVISNAPH